eukprot:TRINITY_DN17174_c0_g1_i1.p1 TRINITY_DN17174_c0_g1~~TRINITY_DN17174_c0_g1_i1.p1  ORF type:complete len:103 (+),score=26.04 TRINITY_DN17174_c0_g1_i1:2-310(+)
MGLVVCVWFFFSSRRRHTRCREVSWARRCVQETGPLGRISREFLQSAPRMFPPTLFLNRLFNHKSIRIFRRCLKSMIECLVLQNVRDALIFILFIILSLIHI